MSKQENIQRALSQKFDELSNSVNAILYKPAPKTDRDIERILAYMQEEVLILRRMLDE